MKIALVNPPSEAHITRRWRCAIKQGHYLYPPLELCYVGGVLKRKKSSEVLLIDCIAEHVGNEKLFEMLGNFKPNITIFMPGFENIETDMAEMVDLKKKIGGKLLCFGFYPTLFAKEIMEKFDVDFVVRGEPEMVISKFYDVFENGKLLSSIKGLTYRKGKSIKKNPDTGEIRDLDNLPFPDRSLINNTLYYSPFPDKKPFTTMLTTRGCPYRCTYCIRTYGNKFRQRSVQNVISEIDEMVEKHSIKSLYINDDTFTANKNWVIEFCNMLANKEYEIEWTCLSRPETLDMEMLRAMKNAGCKRILVGIESGSDKILKYYGRNYDLKKIKSLFSGMRKIGIQSFGFFMLGAPIEEKEDIQKSLEIAKMTKPDFITLNIFRLYPGTKLFSDMQKSCGAKFSLFPHDVTFKTNLSEEEIRKSIFDFYKSYYFHTSYMLTHMGLFFGHLVHALKLFKEFLGWEKRGTNV